MAIDITATVRITRPRSIVAAYATNPRNDPIWIGGIREAQFITKPPLKRRSRVARVAYFLGRRIDYVLEVSEFKKSERVVMRSVESPFPMLVTYAFADSGKGTRMSIRVQGESRKLYGLADFLMGPMVKWNVSADLKRLKGILETGAA